MRLPAASLPNTIRYVVGLSDTITHIALQFNTTPTELSRLNHLSSSLLYPGQSLIVPIKPANISTIVPEHVGSIIHSTKHVVSLEKEIILNQNQNIDNLLINNEIRHSSDDEILRKYLKVKSKYVTDGHGVVSGVLLVTPQTVMFNPCVSDHLVMERGVDMYVVRLPLRAISRIILFEDIAAMVVGDLTKQYMPKVEYLDYQVDYLSPKPGMVICQETGDKYVIPTTSVRGEGILVREKDGIIKRNVGSPEFAIEMNVSQASIESSKRENDQSITDLGIGSSHEFMSSDLTVGDITMTLQLSEPPLSTKGNECEGFSDFIHQSQLSSTPKHKTTECLTNDPTNSNTQKNITQIGLIVEKDEFCPQHLDHLTKGATSVTSTDNLLEHLLPIEVGDDVPNKILENEYNVFANLYEDCSQCPENIDLIENHFDRTPDSADQDQTIRMLSVPIKSEVKEDLMTSNIASLEFSDASQSCNLSKDSGTSDGSFANSPIHDANDLKAITHCATLQQTTSLLSDEARQWLGKRGVKLSLDESWGNNKSGNNEIMKEDITPRPATKVDDHLMYVALKVDKTYWCPIRAKHNQIMGIPPNRDQKRREHWFAVPKDKVDQFYNFLLYWSPDLYGDDSSGFSTPCSSECDNLDEKLLRVDTKGSDICRSRSLHSVSSKSSTCSLGGDEMPDLQTDSQLLSKLHIQKLTHKLPSRTVGHSWELVYSTTIHGISLSTLYRNCQGYDSPILIVIKDENQKVFGAFLSEAPKVSEGFFGTGESMLFSFVTDTKMMTYMWTGDNNFFIKGSKTSLVVGGGEGVFGLWLDEDLYHGHSHSCKTFGNDTLSSSEDFICCGLEAWGFV